MSRCRNETSCGRLCLAPPISLPSDLPAYTNCTVLLNSLVLRDLPSSVDHEALMVLSGVQTVLGSVIIADNKYLASLWFLPSLHMAENVTVTNNFNLVDARLPSLAPQIAASAVSANNFRLCPQRSIVPDTASTVLCAGIILKFWLYTSCPDLAASFIAIANMYLNGVSVVSAFLFST